MYSKTLPFAHGLNIFRGLSTTPGSMLFSSVGAKSSGKDLLLFDPIRIRRGWVRQSPSVKLEDESGAEISLHEILNTTSSGANAGITAGFFSYELNQLLENLPTPTVATCQLPDLMLCQYLRWIEVDYERNCVELFSADKSGLGFEPQKKNNNFSILERFSKAESQDDYEQKVKRILDYIRSGDCYQVNYAQQFKAAFTGDSFAAFETIAKRVSAPYGAYVNTGFGEILSFSPEQFIAANQNGNVTTRPIKGTAPRSSDPIIDAANAKELINSEKNRAENLMIVDLLRNDLGRSCATGSVTTDKLFELESYSNVHHLVSTVKGHLKPSQTPLSALISAFPGGSITGAPKIRSMEIINELEPVRRSAYCGSVFYQKPDGTFDSNILIRTMTAADGELRCWGGGGIVADSSPAQEYQESLDKVQVFMDILEES